MTVPGSPITETVTVAVAARIFTASIESLPTNPAGVSVTSRDATATATDYLTLTSVLSIVEPSSTSAVADQGPYSFNIDSGTTSWLSGKTPSNTHFLATSTYVVTLVPVPQSSPVFDQGSEQPPSGTPTTSYTTTFLTTMTTEMHTQTVTELVSSGVATAKIFSGLGSSGWNITYSTLRTIKVAGDGVRVVKTAPSALEKTGFHEDKLLPLSGSALAQPTPTPSTNSTQQVHARQLGAVIDAIIDNVAVSWTNGYQGSSTATSVVTTILEATMVTISVTSPGKLVGVLSRGGDD